jgi:malonate transporter and related proteins
MQSLRANTAIIGLAYVANTYGNAGVALAAIYVASTTVLHNPHEHGSVKA